MEHIKDNLKKYSSLKEQSDELSLIKQRIIEITKIEPESIKIKNDTLYIRAKNNYEAVELRMQIGRIKKMFSFEDLKIY